MSLFGQNNSKKKVIVYNRKSRGDSQKNSIIIQKEQARKYSEMYGLDIVAELSDGKSGLLGPDEREGFGKLLEMIKDPKYIDVEYILVLDESRWGRFQNENAAPHYEYLCNQEGKSVIYTSDNIPPESQKSQMGFKIYKDVKRKMASEYSRELSNKVFYGCVKVSEQGFSAGGAACYGMSRMMIDEDGTKTLLKKGKHKGISNARVVFVPSNDETTQTVAEIFKQFDQGISIAQIARTLNKKKILSANGGKWNKGKLLRILTNPIYTGTRIYNKTWSRLRQKAKKNPIDKWVIKEDAFESIVDKEMFYRVQERLYWLTPSRWKRGIYTVRKAKKSIYNELKNYFINKGVKEEDLDYSLRQFPVIYAVTISPVKSNKYWCFTIPDELRKYDFLLGVGVSLEKEKIIDRVFVIPTQDLGSGNISIFSEKDEEYSRYYVRGDEVERKVSEIIKEIFN